MLSDWWLRTLDSTRLLVGVQGGLERFADGSATLGPVACTDALGRLLPAPSLLPRRLGFLRLLGSGSWEHVGGGLDHAPELRSVLHETSVEDQVLLRAGVGRARLQVDRQ